MGLEVTQHGNLQCLCVGCFQHHFRREPGDAGLFPAAGAQAPAVTGVEAGKAIFGALRRQIIASGLAEGEELLGHYGAHGVEAGIGRIGVAAAVAIPAGQRFQRAGQQWPAEHILRCHAGPLFDQCAAQTMAATSSAAPAW